MKKIILFLLGFVALSLGVNTNVLAGLCSVVGGTMVYDITYNKTFTNASDNSTDTVVTDGGDGLDSIWNKTSYSAMCNCSDTNNNSSFGNVYYSAVVPLNPGSGYMSGQYNFFYLNPYVEVSMMVYIKGGLTSYVQAPFSNINNEYGDKIASNLACAPASVPDFGTGAQGKVTLHITKPFVGQLQIPRTEILRVFGAVGSKGALVNVPTGGVPMSQVFMSGYVTVVQGCVMATPFLTIDFGDINRDNFVSNAGGGGKGNIPTGTSAKPVKISYNCTNMSNGIQLTLSFQGTSDPNLPDALKTDNPDVAVMIDDAATGKHIPQNNDATDAINLNYNNVISPNGSLTAVANLNVYPVSATGDLPGIGSVNATTTMHVDIK